MLSFTPFQETGKRTVYKIQTGKISLTSEAPLEVIRAESVDLRGLIDTTNKTFAFTVTILSFHGFNGPLQKEHFNENYMESEKYPVATFIGKIIEEIDFTKTGKYEIRTKGVLNIHGVKQERIINSKIEISNNKMQIQSKFKITIADHNIRIPKVVYQKIAAEIDAEIEAVLLLTTY
ncbi:MAG: YceI family protein [Bacteroidetes bacterium]|nr:YceI family protein [Bacteroidota bacterium]